MSERKKREVAYRVFSMELNSASQIEAGVDTYDPNYIVTEHRIGYRFYRFDSP